MQLVDVDAIDGSTHKAVRAARVTSEDGVVVVDDILGIQGEPLVANASDAIHGKLRPARNPLTDLAELRALRDSGLITTDEYEARKAALWRQI